jgi:hypothetical protein
MEQALRTQRLANQRYQRAIQTLNTPQQVGRAARLAVNQARAARWARAQQNAVFQNAMNALRAGDRLAYHRHMQQYQRLQRMQQTLTYRQAWQQTRYARAYTQLTFVSTQLAVAQLNQNQQANYGSSTRLHYLIPDDELVAARKKFLYTALVPSF